MLCWQHKEAEQMEILRVEDLCKIYGEGENAVKALDHVLSR